ncbi:amidohydrolase [Kineosporia sp. J2-2]|uniref:Amidohydrolase n=1 Tax=Kineosporia corallincola TaxID=2835133 RepID=A0ABS5TC33_9ACTN|nr:amidohydrolase [Kineosporia corallincola]MBT0767969.1 amidohydrolase [Kineosporia corallincola]
MNIPEVAPLVAAYADELIDVRRDIHAHPELGFQEMRTTGLVFDRLAKAGLNPQRLSGGTGLWCDIGPAGAGRTVALRADLDALPLPDRCERPWASTHENAAHACGHDVHTTALLGAALALADLHERSPLPGRVRLIFQPAEEKMPGGALKVLGEGLLDGVTRAYGLHCDPRTDVGRIGSRVGPITAAADHVSVTLTGQGGHTSRPHLTQDVVFALAAVVTGVPAALSRRVDPRAGASMVWGRVNSGVAMNAIPSSGEVAGTFRCLDSAVWTIAGSIITDTIQQVVQPYGVRAEVDYKRGVPPTVNDADAVALAEAAVLAEIGEGALELTPQSLGGEDFAWILEKVPGAMVRLGTRTPGGATYDLHRPDFDVDERAIGIGATFLAATAVRDLFSD